MKKDVPTHMNFRVDPKLRYLLGLAAQAKQTSLTDYIEAALWESFKDVSIDQYPELSSEEEPFPSGLSKEEIFERVNKRKYAPAKIERSLSDAADALWDESPYSRLAMLSVLAPHLMSDLDNAVWNHINGKSFKKRDGKPDRNRIQEQWEQILNDVFNQLVTNAKGKAKGDD